MGGDAPAQLAEELAAHTATSSPTLLHFRTRTGTHAQLGRSKISPAEAKSRLMRHLGLA